MLDYVNALYVQQLRLLSQTFGRPDDICEKQILVNAATDLMYAMTSAAEVPTIDPADRLIFVGELIDQGPDNRGVINTVRPLVESGHAVCLMGNHELNAVLFHTVMPMESH